MAESEKPEGKKREIIELAFNRFYEGGFHATGVDTVLAGSGISKRTLYKYFASKEDLIESVLAHYGEFIMHELFDPLDRIEDPKKQIMAFFDVRQDMMDHEPTRGCLGMKASQEYIGTHGRIVALGKAAAQRVEERFVDLCERARLARPKTLAKQIGLLFQGALLLAHVSNDRSAFASAKAAASVLLKASEGAGGTEASPPRG